MEFELDNFMARLREPDLMWTQSSHPPGDEPLAGTPASCWRLEESAVLEVASARRPEGSNVRRRGLQTAQPAMTERYPIGSLCLCSDSTHRMPRGGGPTTRTVSLHLLMQFFSLQSILSGAAAETGA